MSMYLLRIDIEPDERNQSLFALYGIRNFTIGDIRGNERGTKYHNNGVCGIDASIDFLKPFSGRQNPFPVYPYFTLSCNQPLMQTKNEILILTRIGNKNICHKPSYKNMIPIIYKRIFLI